MTSPSDIGLQAERTGLAWSRTSLAAAANAALLAVRDIDQFALSVALVPAALALLVAAATAIYGRRRTLSLRHRPLPSPLAARVAVPLLGATVVLLSALIGLVTIVGGPS